MSAMLGCSTESRESSPGKLRGNAGANIEVPLDQTFAIGIAEAVDEKEPTRFYLGLAHLFIFIYIFNDLYWTHETHHCGNTLVYWTAHPQRLFLLITIFE